MLKFRFDTDFAGNWRAGTTVPCTMVEGGCLVDGVAAVDVSSLQEHGEFIYSEDCDETEVFRCDAVISKNIVLDELDKLDRLFETDAADVYAGIEKMRKIVENYKSSESGGDGPA